MTLCKNCQANIESKYCPDCGQKASTKRFSTKILFSQLMDKLLPLDKGVLYTTWQLLTRPGPMLREYIDGKRVGYTKPFQFLLIVVAFSLILFSQEDFTREMNDTMHANTAKYPEIEKAQQEMVAFVSSKLNLILLGMIPFLALTGRWFYRKHDVNYAEHFVMSCYLLAGCSIITMPVMWAMQATGNMSYMSTYIMSLFIMLNLAYYMWAHVGFFRESNRIWNALKGLLTYLIAYGIYILLVGIVGAIAIGVYMTWFKAPVQ